MKVSSDIAKNASAVAVKIGGLGSARIGASGAIALLASSGSALAQSGGQDVGQLAQGWNGQFTNLGRLFLNGATLIGVVTAGAGLLELKRAHDPENQGRANAKSAGTKIMVGGGMAALAGIVNVGIGTIFSGGGGTSTVSQGSITFGG